jgi:DNA-directed RNA polymerase specialized sigma24 family protein
MDIKELESATTVELVEYIQGKAGYLDAAECAFRNLFVRFENELTKKCRQVAMNWGFDQTTGDILSEQALAKFWEKPESFRVEICTVKNIDRCLFFYLLRMARNALADRQREVKSGRTYYNGDEAIVFDFPDHAESNLSVEQLNVVKAHYEKIDTALKRLTPKHKIIYLTYRTWEKEHINLPRKLLKNLREELDLDQDSIRVYKMEAKQEVDQYLAIYDK